MNVWRICRTASLFTLALLAAPLYSIDTAETNPHLLHPKILGRGGSLVGQDFGYLAVLSNPARVAIIPGEATFFSGSGWLHSNIDTFFPSLIAFLKGEASGQERSALESVLSNNGMGFGAGLGAGYYGDGFGIGLNIASDALFFGTSFPNELYGTLTTDVRLAFSVAYSFEVEPAVLAVGLVLEPLYRLHSSFSAGESADIIEQYFKIDAAHTTSHLSADNTLYGSGVAFHAGFLLEILEDFTVSVVFRDIGDTRIDYSRTSLQNVNDHLQRFALPPTALLSEDGYIAPGSHIFPTDIRLGLAYHPEWNAGVILSPLFLIEIGHFNLITDPPKGYNFLHLFHLGFEMGIDNLFFAQIGLNQAQFTLGLGLNSGVFEIYGAWFGRVVDEPQKYFSSHGVALSFLFRD